MKGWKSQVKRETYYSVPVQLYPKQPHHQKMQNICVAGKITATLQVHPLWLWIRFLILSLCKKEYWGAGKTPYFTWDQLDWLITVWIDNYVGKNVLLIQIIWEWLLESSSIQPNIKKQQTNKQNSRRKKHQKIRWKSNSLTQKTNISWVLECLRDYKGLYRKKCSTARRSHVVQHTI